uniref:Peptidase M12B domain-containing protein n=1 Tax=Panagrellus redivivus TaxID=6233 RepID=A0A7E4W332_PANRE
MFASRSSVMWGDVARRLNFIIILVFFNFTVHFITLATASGQEAGGEPAVWGTPPLDYSNVNLTDASKTYVYALIFVEAKITNYYNNDLPVMRREIMRMIRQAILYFGQLDIHLGVVDIIPVNRNNWTVEKFREYHAQNLKNYPYHNFASMISLHYNGGKAYVSAACDGRNVMHVGFYPHDPEGMGSVYFHEVAHILGSEHLPRNETFTVENCPCEPRPMSFHVTTSGNITYFTPTEGCLKIPGYDHDCTVQYLVNQMSHFKNRCLPKSPRTNSQNVDDGYPDWSHADPDVAICGNGIVEGYEECDCGLPSKCNATWNCMPSLCRRKVPLWTIALIIAISTAIVTVICISLAYCIVGMKCIAKKVQKLKRLFKKADQHNFMHSSQNVSLISNLSEPKHHPRPTMPPPPPPSIVPLRSPYHTLVSSEARDYERPESISHKFADFDDEFGSENDFHC